MTTLTLWLLVSAGTYSTLPTVVVERFATAEECERVRHLIAETRDFYRPTQRCIQATVVRDAR